MRILVVGAYGLIGTYVTVRLLADGHEIIGAGRDIRAAQRRFPDLRWIPADLARCSVEDWAAALSGVEAVVNCAGALQDSPRDDLRAVHLEGVERLAQACVIAGVQRLVHISAAGVSEGRASPFNDTKLAAEQALAQSRLDWVILRPGLVLAPAAYGGTALLRGLAAFPFVVRSVHGESLVQAVSAEDVAAAVARAVAPDAPARLSVDLVHAQPWRLDDLIAELRRWLGLPAAPNLPVPTIIAQAVAQLCDGLSWLGWRSPLRSESLRQLRMGVTGAGEDAERKLGLRLRSVREMLGGWPAGVQERWFAKAYFVKPLALTVLALFWLASGLIGLTVSRAQAVAVLTDAQMSPALANGAVVIGSLVDLALGLAVCFRRSASLALKGMLVVSAGYMAAGTLVRPDLWLDPLGPFMKTIPAALLALAVLALMDER